MTRALLRVLARLFPRGFRREVGEAWLDTAEHLLARERGLGKLRALVALVADSAAAIPTAHRAERARLLPMLTWELGQACRSLLRRPRFTVVATAVLALGLGVNTAVFSVANAALLRPLQYPDPSELVIAWSSWRAADFDEAPLSPAQLAELAAREDVFEAVGGVWASSATLTGGEYAEQVSVGRATASLFSALQVSPQLGRLLADDDAADPADPEAFSGVLLSHGFWQRYFGADPGALGTTMRLDGALHRVVGVLPPGFRLRFPPGKGIPGDLEVYTAYPPLEYLPPDQFYLRVIGRLQPDVDLGQARLRLETSAERLRERRPELADADARFDLRSLQHEWTRDLRPALLGVQAVALLLLVLTLTNVTSLVVAWVAARLPAFAIRACLGAERGRLVRQLAWEGVLLALAGLAAGAVLGQSALSLLWAVRPGGLERIVDVGPDVRVLAFAAAVALAATAVLASGPILMLSRTRPSSHLLGRVCADETITGTRLRRAACVVQIAATFGLLVAASLMAGTVANLSRVDVGFDPQERMTFTIGLPRRQFPTGQEKARVVDRVEQAVLAVPGVAAVGAGSHPPLGRWVNWASAVVPSEAPEDTTQQGLVDHRAVSPGYFAAIGAEITSGRDFDGGDVADGEQVAIVDLALAHRLYGDRSPLSRQVIVSQWHDDHFERVEARIVGVVAPVRDRSVDEPSPPQVFLPFAQTPRWEAGFVVRAAPLPDFGDRVRRAVAGVDPELAVAGLRPMTDDYQRSLGVFHFAMLLAQVLAAAALVLSAIGLYGALTLETHGRRREIGIRMALGARTAQVRRMVLRSSTALAAGGIALGLPFAWGLATLLESSLFGVRALAPWAYAPAAVLAIGVGLLAAVLPARRATRQDPSETLRS